MNAGRKLSYLFVAGCFSAAAIAEPLSVYGQVQTFEDDNSVTVGADYKLGKSTKAFIWYIDRGLDKSEDKSWLAAGLEHNF